MNGHDPRPMDARTGLRLEIEPEPETKRAEAEDNREHASVCLCQRCLDRFERLMDAQRAQDRPRSITQFNPHTILRERLKGR